MIFELAARVSTASVMKSDKVHGDKKASCDIHPGVDTCYLRECGGAHHDSPENIPYNLSTV